MSARGLNCELIAYVRNSFDFFLYLLDERIYFLCYSAELLCSSLSKISNIPQGVIVIGHGSRVVAKHNSFASEKVGDGFLTFFHMNEAVSNPIDPR